MVAGASSSRMFDSLMSPVSAITAAPMIFDRFTGLPDVASRSTFGILRPTKCCMKTDISDLAPEQAGLLAIP